MRFTRRTWLFGLLGLLPVGSTADRIDTYPPVNSDRVESETYELRRLLCKSCGHVADLVYLPERDSFFASTRSGDVWQINSQGHIVDVLRGLGALPDSGVYFGSESYIDWVFSGDKAPKAYLNIANADYLSDEEFNVRLQAAEARSARLADQPGRVHYYLREGGGWRLLSRQREITQDQPLMRLRCRIQLPSVVTMTANYLSFALLPLPQACVTTGKTLTIRFFCTNTVARAG